MQYAWLFLDTCNKALNLYYGYNDKVFKWCYSICQKNRTAGSERKGNAADTYIQFMQYISPE